METPSTSRTGAKICANIKEVRHDKLKRKQYEKYFK